MRADFICLVSIITAGVGCGSSEFQGVESTRATAHRVPGARQAIDFAMAVNHAARAGDYRYARAKLVYDVTDALHAIDAVQNPVAIDLATLVYWRGLLLSDTGDQAAAMSEMERSFSILPTMATANVLIGAYGGHAMTDKVSATCRAAFDAIPGTSDRLALVDTCHKNMNAATPEGGNAWMTPAQFQWAHDATIANIEGMEADQARQAERDRAQQHVVRVMEQCSQTCKEDGLRCQNRCRHDQDCSDRCVEINHACLDRCESQANDSLEQ